jgi:hypothetical protein
MFHAVPAELDNAEALVLKHICTWAPVLLELPRLRRISAAGHRIPFANQSGVSDRSAEVRLWVIGAAGGCSSWIFSARNFDSSQVIQLVVH